ncbi:putative quinol monooxygenase [Ruegeria sp.]|uniref:putative quinol monooxygenase n=1 Tax=Ruegeria sp. TaxID=1879320 RepID=UPI00230BD56A|nr:putative quinol monooxygenase [Ruegeria sp.]MDA7963835.1 antibiotic biosynthesis monooxygenase [Ruegeria sp.]
MNEGETRVWLRGQITVPAERLAEVRAALPEHIALSRAEPGCLSFDVIEDETDPGRFSVTELFENRAAFDAHQTRTRASDWFHITQGIPRDYEVTEEPS